MKSSLYHGLRRIFVALTLVVGLSVGTALVSAPAAQAASWNCKWPRCTVYLSKAETHKLAYNGTVPRLSEGGSWTKLYYAFAVGHRWFAKQYDDRGMCVAFSVGLVPWERQGMWGYAC